jgi:hypothetical protein
MGVEFFHFGGHARRLVIIAFALWLAVAAHLACRGSACADEALVARVNELSHEHAPNAMGAADSHCHAHIRQERRVRPQRESGAASSEPDSATMLTTPLASHAESSCCVSAGQTADGVPRPRLANDPLGVDASYHPPSANAERGRGDSPSRVERLPDRGGTYLRGCVFLI